MKAIPHLKRNLIKRIFALFSFTTALFVFQACYGMDIPPDQSVQIEGIVKSKKTNLPIKGIEVSIRDNLQDTINHDIIAYTDEKGKFFTWAGNYEYTPDDDRIRFAFRDTDSTNNGEFFDLDTLIYPDYNRDIYYVEILLRER